MMSPIPNPNLNGMTVLIVEDEFYLAVEMQDEIESASGTVIGPFADLEAGLASLDHTRPDCALIDINLGSGPSFDMADALQAQGIPFLFLTGYDASAIPDRFDSVQRIQKPANVTTLLHTLLKTRA